MTPSPSGELTPGLAPQGALFVRLVDESDEDEEEGGEEEEKA